MTTHLTHDAAPEGVAPGSDTARPPAGSAVQVSALFRPELLVEIQAFAVVAERRRP
ncbi:RidA family protein [Streptomyces thermolilacinus]|uniref:RidA family protein n=1 Tax=Streptomyces thermolilacinus TaxID=285540 RepID=UPI003F4D0C95